MRRRHCREKEAAGQQQRAEQRARRENYDAHATEVRKQRESDTKSHKCARMMLPEKETKCQKSDLPKRHVASHLFSQGALQPQALLKPEALNFRCQRNKYGTAPRRFFKVQSSKFKVSIFNFSKPPSIFFIQITTKLLFVFC